MEPRYDDDEMITDIPLQDESDSFEGGKTTATFFNNNDAPLTETNFTVLMKLTGSKETANRPGLDLVLLLDVSGSMNRHDRIGQLKTATKFLIKKLSPIDRLSVVKFSNNAKRLCPLRQMNEDAQSEIEGLINDLVAKGATNMTKALAEAVKVVNDRRLTKGREVAIMFMSDGEPNPEEADGSQIDIQNVPVYTFGLGQDCDHSVLSNIASRSKLATFSTADVGNDETSNLGVAFSQCLAGLLTVVVQDLTLTIKHQPPGSKIVNVSAGRYPVVKDDSDGSVTVSFGNLYSKEMRNILVDLVLPKVTDSKGVDILEYTYSYKEPKTQEVFEALPLFVTVTRTQYASTKENPEVSLEKARQQTAEKMKEAMQQADNNDLAGARATVNDAQNDLRNNDNVEPSNPNIEALLSELSQFSKFLESPEIYQNLGRAFVTAALLSHALQRFASKGNVNEQRMYATDAMTQLLDQINKFQNIPDYVVPKPDEDKKELDKIEEKSAIPKPPADPVAAIAEALSTHLGQAIESLKAIQEIINAHK